MFFDAHCDALSCEITAQISLNQYARGRQFDFFSAQGIVDWQVLAIFVPRANRQDIVYADFVELQKRLMDEIIAAKNVTLMTKSSDLRHSQPGQIGILLALEGAEVLEGSLERLGDMYALGLRAMTFTWNNDNALACGCMTQKDMGLLPLGQEALHLAERLGIAVDIAHLSSQGIADVFRLAQAPMFNSHAACAALCPHVRNLSDRQMKTLAQNDGVLGIAFVDEFLRPDYHRASIDDVIAHIVHAAEVMGSEHVGLGSDFDGVERPLPGLTKVGDLPFLQDKLLQKGFNPHEIAGILGGNWQRFFENVLP